MRSSITTRRNGFSVKPDPESLLTFLRESIRAKIASNPYTPVVVLKARDIGMDRSMQTLYGRVLSAFCSIGFGKKANGRRPIRYVINHAGIRWALTCSYPECDPSKCMFREACPYRVIAGVKP